MVQIDDPYYELFLLPNRVGFVSCHLFFAISGPTHLKIFRDRGIRSNNSDPAKWITTSIFRLFFGLIKSSLSLSFSDLSFQLLIKIVDALSSNKLTFETYKSEKKWKEADI